MGIQRKPDEFVVSQESGSTRDGLTVIELFAMAAMQGMLSRERGQVPDNIPVCAFNMAEAMVAEYNKRYGKE